MKVTNTHCDVCKRKLNYTDIDSNKHIAGFSLNVQTKDPAYPDTPVRYIKLSNHIPTKYGSSSVPTPTLAIPETVCSTKCMRDWVTSWCDSLPIVNALDIEDYDHE